MIRKALFSSIVVALAAFGLGADRFAPHEILVKFKPGAALMSVISVEALGAQVAERYDFIGWTKVKLPSDVTADEGIAYFKTFGDVLYAEKNLLRKPQFTPNDPSYAQQ